MSTASTSSATPRGDALARYIAGTLERRFPPEVLEAAQRALVDFIAVAVGACDDAPVKPVRATIREWQAHGNARIILGGKTTPALAVLANGTMAHAMDYDDTHPGGAGHPSAPCWSTALALTEHGGYREQDAIAAFVTGYEVMAKLGGGFAPGVGRSLQRRGFHPTSVFGRTGAAAVACVLMRLDAQRTLHALANTATTAGGLLGSFGTHGKPFHAGKAAMDGILGAQMAAAGYVGGTQLFELEKGLLDAFIQDRQVDVPPLDFESWEILTNGFKLFASCRATHASTQAARSLAQQVAGRKVARVHAKVHPNALVTAGKTAPRTPLECKFSVPCCISMALTGRRVVYSDFTENLLRDAAVADILPKVKLEAIEGQAPHSAHLDVYLEDGTHLHGDTDIVRGHPDNPLSWDEIRGKFVGLVEPKLGAARTEQLFEAARAFGAPGSMQQLSALLEGDRT
jgi:2-methylcitrate dehydratase PrpD